MLLLKVERKEKPPPNIPLKGEGFFPQYINPAFLVGYEEMLKKGS